MNSLPHLLFALAALRALAAPVTVTNLVPQPLLPDASPPLISVHDPVMIRQDGTFYLFVTGQGIGVWTSKDLRHWKREKPVSAAPPAWAVEAVPTFKGYIWAPDVSYHDGKYYLYFASIDYCCRGARSDYKMMVGRARQLVGPYLDKSGISLARGGGTVLLAGDARWYGVGHNAVCTFDGVDYLVFHGYDSTDRRRAILRIEKLTWDGDGWPVVPITPADPESARESVK